VQRFAAEAKTKGGLLIPEKSQGKVLDATVVAVGPGAKSLVKQWSKNIVTASKNNISLFSLHKYLFIRPRVYVSGKYPNVLALCIVRSVLRICSNINPLGDYL